MSCVVDYSAPVGERSIAISLSVCLCVYLSVREHISGTAGLIFAELFVQIPCISPVVVARYSSGDIAIRYVLPVLWMTSHLAVMGRMAKRGRLNLYPTTTSGVTIPGGVWCLWIPCLLMLLVALTGRIKRQTTPATQRAAAVYNPSIILTVGYMTDTLRIEPRLIRWLHCSISLYGLKFESTGYILVADCICLTSSCLALWAAKVANNYVGSRASNLLPIDMTSCYWLILTSALSLSVSGLRFCQLKSRFCDTPLYHSTPSLDLAHENITKHNRGKIYTLCYQLCKTAESYVYLFLPERDYVTFGSLLSQFHLSSVCNVGAHYSGGSSRCPPAIFLHRCVRWPSSDLRAKFYGDRPRGTPPWDALNARGVSKYSDFAPVEGYIS